MKIFNNENLIYISVIFFLFVFIIFYKNNNNFYIAEKLLIKDSISDFDILRYYNKSKKNTLIFKRNKKGNWELNKNNIQNNDTDNNKKIYDLISSLKTYKYQDIFRTDKNNLIEYGLDDPNFIIEFKSSKKSNLKKIINIGNVSKFGNKIYMSLGHDKFIVYYGDSYILNFIKYF